MIRRLGENPFCRIHGNHQYNVCIDSDGISKHMLAPCNAYCLTLSTIAFVSGSNTTFKCVNIIIVYTVCWESVPVVNHFVNKYMFSDVQTEPSFGQFIMISQTVIISWPVKIHICYKVATEPSRRFRYFVATEPSISLFFLLCPQKT